MMRPTRLLHRKAEAYSRRPGLVRRLLSMLVVVATVASTFTVALQVVSSTPAAAATTPITATFSPTPTCGTYSTATPPAGAVSATVTISGGGGGGGGAGGGAGAAGGAISSTTLALTHTTGAVSVDLGCGGGNGVTTSGSGTNATVPGGAGYAAGGAGGSAQSNSGGHSSGGSGGGASGLCLGTTSCTTPVVVAAGGGGGGGQDTAGTAGNGGAGQNDGSAAVSPGVSGTAGSGTVTGGGGGTSSAGGGGGTGSPTAQGGTAGSDSPYSSPGGAAGNGASNTHSAGGGGGGGGYTGGGGGGGSDGSSSTEAGGGGGGGSSTVNATYGSSPTYGAGGAGGAAATAGTAGSITLTWNVDALSVTNPGTQSNVAGSGISGLTIAAAYDTTGGNSVTFSATGLPAGLSISSSGAITGTPTTACACSVTVTATDSQALTANTTFTWNISPGAPAKLIYTTEPPTSGTAGTALANFAVAVEDANGNIETTGNTGSTDTITLSIATGPAGGVFNPPSTTYNVAASNGTANFPGVVLDTAGSYTFTATDTTSGDTGLATATSTPATVVSATTPITATFSPTPTCGTYSTATPPAGAVSATVTISGGGGGGGGAGGGAGAAGGAISSTTLALTHTTGAVSVDLGCGGGNGVTTSGSGTNATVPGGAGYAAGGAGGSAQSNSGGHSSGGSGGGASGLCLGTTSCTTPVVVAAGGGGGGGQDTAGTAGNGGAGQNDGSAAVSPGVSGTAGSGTVTGGGGGTSSAGGGGGTGSPTAQGGTAGSDSPYSSPGGAAGNGASNTHSAGGGGGGGGYTGGGGGGGSDGSSSTEAGGGGGGGSSTVNATYGSSPTYGAGGAGGAAATAGTAGSITLTWNVDALSVTNPGTQSNVAGSAITTLPIQGSHATTGGNSVTFSATGLPAGLSISSSGAITGTPTTACACSVTVTATDSQALTANTTFTWNISPGAPAKLIYTTEPPTSGTAGTALANFAVAVEDANGNIETTGNTGSTDTITLSIATGPAGGVFNPPSTTYNVAASNGTANFPGVVLDTAGSYTFTATDTTSGDTGVTTITSTPATTINPAAPKKLAYTTEPPTTGTAGTALTSFAASVEDTYGNVETTGNTGATDTITLSIATGPAGGVFNPPSTTYNVAASNGTATFPGVVLDTAGSYTFTATDSTSGRSGVTTTTSTPATTINPNTTTSLSLTTPSSPTSGASFNETITAIDQYGNVVTGYSGTKTLTWTGTGTPASSPNGTVPLYPTNPVTFTSGSATVAITLYDAQTGVVLKTSDGTYSGTSGSFNVAAGSANSLSVPTPANQTAGASFNETITAIDTWGNTVTNYSGTKTLTWTGTGTPANSPNGTAPLYPTNPVTFTSGSATVAITLYDAQTGVVLKTSDGTISGTSATFNVVAGGYSQLVLSTPSPTAGTSFTETVTAADAWQNPVSNESGAQSVTWASGAGFPANAPLGTAPSYPTTLNFNTTSGGIANSQASATITLYDAQSGIALKATVATKSGTSATFNVLAGTLNSFTVPTPPTHTAGTAFNETIAAIDTWGNAASGWTSATNCVTFSGPSNSPNNTAPQYSIPGGSCTTGQSGLTFNSAGQATASITLYNASTSTTLTVTSNSAVVGKTGSSSMFVVTALSTVSSLAITNVASPQTAGSGFSVTVTGKDTYGNTVNNSTDSVTLGVASGPQSNFTSITANPVTLVGGIATFNGVTFNLTGTTYALTAKDTTTNVTAPNSNTFTVQASGLNDMLVFTPTALGAGTAGSSIPNVAVSVEDTYGNVVTTATGSVVMSINSGPQSSFTSGTTSVPLSSGVANFTNLVVDTSGSYTFTATPSGINGVTTAINSSAVTVNPAPANKLAFSQQPSNAFATVAMTPAVIVQVEDQFGNAVPDNNLSITLTPSANSITSGATTSTNSSGQATFSSITINTAATGLTLTASPTNAGTGVASAKSAAPGFTVSVLVRYGNATLTDTASDAGSGVASVSYYYCSGFSGGCSPGTFIGTSTSGSGSSWTYIWSTGQPTVDGAYQVVAVGTDNLNNTSLPSSSIPVTVDNTAPTGSVSYTNGYQNNTSVSVAFNASDSVSGINASTGVLKRASATLSGGTCGTFSSYTQVGATGLSSPYTDTTVTSGNCYKYENVVSDYAGNQTTITSADTVEIDTAAPSVTVTYPVTSTTYGPNWTGTITGTASDAIGTVSSTAVAVENTTTNLWWNGSSFNGSSADYTGANGGAPTNWTSSLSASNLISGDSYKVVAEATDSAGNTGTSSPVSFTYNTTAPTVAVTYPVTGTTYGTNWTGTITGTASSNSGASLSSAVVAVENTSTSMWWNGTSFTNGSLTYVTASGTPTAWNLPLAASGDLVSGDNYSVTAQATDGAGNVTTTSATTFTYNTTAPTVATIIGQSSGAVVNGFVKKGTGYYVYANVTDTESTVASVTANVTNVTSGDTAMSLTSTGGPFAAPGGGSYTYRSSLLTSSASQADGAVAYTVNATDNLGNTSTYSNNGSVTFDTTAPVNNLTLSGQSGGGSYLSGTTVYYHGSTAGSLTITNALTDSGSGPASSGYPALGGTSTGFTHTGGTVSTPAGGPYVSSTFSWTGSTTSSPTEVVTGTDNVGNTVTTTLTFVNDSTAPVNNLTLSGQSGGGSYLSGTTVYYHGSTAGSLTITNALTDSGSGPASSGYPALGGTSTGFTHTGGTVSTPAGGPYVSSTFSWTGSTTSSPTEVVTGTDNVGNTVTTTLTFVNDSTAPVNNLTLSGQSGGGSYLSGTTVYYQGSTAGSLTITNALTDSGSGPASSGYPALGGTSTGFTYTGGTVSTPAGGPYVSSTFSWTGSTTSSPTEVVTGTDNVGNTVTTTLTFVNDSTAPSGGSISYTNGYNNGLPVSVSFTQGSDSGSGLNTTSGVLLRASATWSGGSCGTFGAFTALASNPTSPYTDSSITSASCYKYEYEVSDNVGNTATYTSTNVVDNPIALVEQAVSTGGASQTTQTVPLGGTTVGDTLVLLVGDDHSNSATVSGVSGGGVSTWTKVTENSGASGDGEAEIWYGQVTSVGNTVTVTVSGSTNWQLANVSEWSGIASSSPVDGSTSSAATATSFTSGPISTSLAGDLVISDAWTSFNTPGFTSPQNSTTSGYTALNQTMAGGSYYRAWGAYQVDGSTGSISAGWTGPGSGFYATAIAAFKP